LPGFAGRVGGVGGVPLCPPPVSTMMRARFQASMKRFYTDGKEQLLHLSFATHEIMVRGHSLRRIETALHRLELSFITTLPAKYHPLVPDGQPKIREIVVTEIKPGGEQSQLN
jgi:hypothetical protein